MKTPREATYRILHHCYNRTAYPLSNDWDKSWVDVGTRKGAEDCEGGDGDGGDDVGSREGIWVMEMKCLEYDNCDAGGFPWGYAAASL